MCIIHHSMCWQWGSFLNERTMLSITVCKSDPIPKDLTMSTCFQWGTGKVSGTMLILSIKHSMLLDLAACVIAIFTRGISKSCCLIVSYFIYQCETVCVPDMSMTNGGLILGSLLLSLCRCLFFCVSLQRSSCFPSSVGQTWTRHQTEPWSCQSSQGGYVYLQEALGSNLCFPKAVIITY